MGFENWKLSIFKFYQTSNSTIEKRVIINENRLPYINMYISTISKEVKKTWLWDQLILYNILF